MATNLHIHDKLLAKAAKAGNHNTKREAVNRAREEYVSHQKQIKICALFGTIDYDDDSSHHEDACV